MSCEYRIIEQIYEGSKSIIYRGQLVSNSKPVIIKVLKNQYPTLEELQQFRHQYVSVVSLKLSGIVKVYALSRRDRGFALIMEDFGAISLDEYLEIHQVIVLTTLKNQNSNHSVPILSLQEFFQIALAIVSILEQLHAQGIVHQGIEAKHILIEPNTKTIKLIDFSWAFFWCRKDLDRPKPKQSEGLFSYLSPEQKGEIEDKVDPRTDLYSTGIILYQLLTGQLPHLSQIISPRQLNPSIPQTLSDLVLKLIDRNPYERYQSAFGLRSDLEKCTQEWSSFGKINPFLLLERDCLIDSNHRSFDTLSTQPSHVSFLTNFTKDLKLSEPEARQTMFNLISSVCETTGNLKELQELKELSNLLLQKSQNLADQIKIYQLQIKIYIKLGNDPKIVETTLAVMKLLGLNLPDKLNKSKILQSLMQTQWAIGSKTPETLLELSETIDSNQKSILEILELLHVPVYTNFTHLTFLLTLAGVTSSVKNGNYFLSALAYVNYGAILCSVVEEFNNGYRFGKLALDLADQLNAKSVKNQTVIIFNKYIRHWQQHLQDNLVSTLEVYQNALHDHNLDLAIYAIYSYCQYAYFTGQDLNLIIAKISDFKNNISIDRYFGASNIFLCQFIEKITFPLTKQESEIENLLNDTQEDKLRSDRQKDSDLYSFDRYCHRLILNYLFEHYFEAIENAEVAEKSIDRVRGSFLVPIFYFYDSLARLAIYSISSVNVQRKILSKINSNQRKMKKWAQTISSNYAHKFVLVEAEKYRVLDNFLEAAKSYDRAIKLAKENEYLNEEALAQELAAKFYLGWAKQKLAEQYLIDAYYNYARWGAITKVKKLAFNYPELIEKCLSRESSNTTPNQNSLALTSSSLSQPINSSLEIDQTHLKIADLTLLLEASQIITQETKIHKVISSLIETIVKNVGAQTGCLILFDREYRQEYQGINTSQNDNQQNFWNNSNFLFFDAFQLEEQRVPIPEKYESRTALASLKIYFGNFPTDRTQKLTKDDRWHDNNHHQNLTISSEPVKICAKQLDFFSFSKNTINQDSDNSLLSFNVNKLNSKNSIEAIFDKPSELSIDSEEFLYRDIPTSVVDWVKQTSKKIIIENITMDSRFNSDPYILKHQPQSIVCMPIIHQNKLFGILYLENCAIEEVFRGGRLQAIELLCSQTAVTLDNFLLTEMVEQSAIREKETSERLERSIKKLREAEMRLIQAQTQLQHGAFHDTLTGLCNRAWLMKSLKDAITLTSRYPNKLYALLFLDLDRFKMVNDGLGHLVGDELLKNVAMRLRGCVRSVDTIARFGGDEFAILLEELENPQEANIIAQRILQQLAQPFKLGDYEVRTGTSIGITISTMGYQQPEDILRDADAAMYNAKAQGKGRYVVFDKGMQELAMRSLQLENDLRSAIDKQQLSLYYQPIIAIDTGILTGFEALVRWYHPQQGWISPIEFIPIAEETGIINEIGIWTLQSACTQLQTWLQQFPEIPSLVVNVNISAIQLKQVDIIERLQNILSTIPSSDFSIKLEITESCILDTLTSEAQRLKQLKELGIGLCIDDFGTGYSSLSRLHEFPIDTLKIDKSFVNRLDRNSNHSETVRAIVTLAHSLGLDVVAEGVETSAQLEKLKELKCEYAQGYLISKPVDQETATQFLSQNQRLLEENSLHFDRLERK